MIGTADVVDLRRSAGFAVDNRMIAGAIRPNRDEVQSGRQELPSRCILAVAAETGATAYDTPGAEPCSHDGELCSFDAFSRFTAPRIEHSTRWR